MNPAISEVLRALDDAFPFAWAEPWDRVGLSVGDANARVTGVLVTLDATVEKVERASSLGASLLVTHHPAFLDPPDTIAPGSGPAGVVFAAASLGVALVACHTNLDRAPAGSDALPNVLGLRIEDALELGRQPVLMVTTYVPALAGSAYDGVTIRNVLMMASGVRWNETYTVRSAMRPSTFRR